MPYQIVPLIIAVRVNESRASISQAGAVGSAILIGQLIAALVLAKMNSMPTHRGFTTVSAVLLLVGLLLTLFDKIFFALAGWLVVGLSCGALTHFGTAVAAQHELRKFALTLRLGVASLLTGLAALLLLGGAALENYNHFIAMLAFFFMIAMSLGAYFFSSDAVGRHKASISRPEKWKLADLVSLLVVYILFTGQAGIVAYVIQQAASRGIGLGDAAWAMAGVKLISGGALLLLARHELASTGRNFFLQLGWLLAGSIVAMSLTTDPLLFFVGLLIFQIALNALSSGLQSQVAGLSPDFGVRWLSAAILLGAATGPFLNGVAISLEASIAFLMFAVLTSFLPATWAFLAAHSRSDPRVC